MNAEKQLDLSVYIDEYTQTLEIMDKFEGRGKGDFCYKRLIINNSHRSKINGFLCYYQLIVERLEDFEYLNAEGDITFTEFKKTKGRDVYNYADRYLAQFISTTSNKKLMKINKNNKREVYFKVPYYLRAQSEYNRIGYGSDWRYGIEGTYYGETSDYAFVGIILESVEDLSKKNNVETKPLVKVEYITRNGKEYYRVTEVGRQSVLIPYTMKMTEEKAITEYFRFKKSINGQIPRKYDITKEMEKKKKFM